MSNFYIDRLRTFSLAEYPYRVRQMLVRKLEQFMDFQGAVTPVPLFHTERVLEPSFHELKVLPDEMVIFGKPFQYGAIDAIDWHKDIFSGRRFPLAFSKGIDIRKDPTLSAKSVWEVNRMQFLLPMAIRYSQTGEPEILDRFIQINRSWINANPYLKGVNWYSNIEVNLRLINWFLCWEVLHTEELVKRNASFHSFVTNEWLPLIKLHCEYSYENPSRFSSANNHLIAEYAGLFIAAAKWPFKAADKWIRYAQNGLEKEILVQHSDEGINKEEAAEYIQFITDFFLLSYIVGKNTKHPFSDTYEAKLQQIIDYIFHFLDCKGAFPKYGDEDDGKCFMTDLDPHFNNFRSLLASGALLFDRHAWKTKSGGYDRKNQLFFGREGKKKFESLPAVSTMKASRFYLQEGHFICRKTVGDREVYLHFDAAPLGFLSIAAHGHADALSFIMHVDGQPVFVDPGTYTYHTEPEWRKYFVSTFAHNTICLNHSDQAQFSGTTLWLKHYTCTVHKAETNVHRDYIEASHNGYRHLGIWHTRSIDFDKEALRITIIDSIRSENSASEYQIEVPFHLHPGVGIDSEDSNIYHLSTGKGSLVELHLDSRLRSSILTGQLEPFKAGWYSDSFLVKERSNTIVGSIKCSGEIRLETVIIIKAS